MVGKTLSHIATFAAREEEEAYASMLAFIKKKGLELRPPSDLAFRRRIEHWQCMARDAPTFQKELIFFEEHQIVMREWLDPRPESEKPLMAYLRKGNMPRHIRWLESTGITPEAFIEGQRREFPHHKAQRVHYTRKAEVSRMRRQNPIRRQVEKRDNPWPAKEAQQNSRGAQRQDKWWLKRQRWRNNSWSKQSWKADRHWQTVRGGQRDDASSWQSWKSWRADGNKDWDDDAQRERLQRGWRGSAPRTWRRSPTQGRQGQAATRGGRDTPHRARSPRVRQGRSPTAGRDLSPDRRSRGATSARRSPRHAHRAGRRMNSRSRSPVGTAQRTPCKGRRNTSSRAASRGRRPNYGGKGGGRAHSTTSERLARGRSRSARREYKKDYHYKRSRVYMSCVSREGTLLRMGGLPIPFDTSPPHPPSSHQEKEEGSRNKWEGRESDGETGKGEHESTPDSDKPERRGPIDMDKRRKTPNRGGTLTTVLPLEGPRFTLRIWENERVEDVAARAARIAGTPGTIHPIQAGGRILNPLQTFEAQLHYTPSIIWQYARLRGG